MKVKQEDLDDLGLEEIARGIENMEIRGAALIARAASIAMEKWVNEYQGDDIDDFKEWMEEGKKRLINTRPTAVSLSNAIRYVLNVEYDDLENTKETIRSRCIIFNEKSKTAAKKIAEYGANRIGEGETILTHCNSTLALGAIKYAWDIGKDVSVIATESRPKKQGYITARQLLEWEIPVTLIVDSAVRHTMKEVDQVFVGADTIASNGALINKIGTSQVALCADEARVPLIVCAESYKFSSETIFGKLVELEERDKSEIVDPKEFPGLVIRNPVFDATPPEYIDVIVTEEGIISPYVAYKIIKEMIK